MYYKCYSYAVEKNAVIIHIAMEIHYYQKFHHFISMPFFKNFAPLLTQRQVRHCSI